MILWDFEEVAGEPGFEPRLTESESVVLPLNYSPTKPLISLAILADLSIRWETFPTGRAVVVEIGGFAGSVKRPVSAIHSPSRKTSLVPSPIAKTARPTLYVGALVVPPCPTANRLPSLPPSPWPKIWGATTKASPSIGKRIPAEASLGCSTGGLHEAAYQFRAAALSSLPSGHVSRPRPQGNSCIPNRPRRAKSRSNLPEESVKPSTSRDAPRLQATSKLQECVLALKIDGLSSGRPRGRAGATGR